MFQKLIIILNNKYVNCQNCPCKLKVVLFFFHFTVHPDVIENKNKDNKTKCVMWFRFAVQ